MEDYYTRSPAGGDDDSSGSLEDLLFGYGAVLLSALSFGSFVVPLKGKKFQEAKLHPIILQFYFSISVFVTSFIQLPITGWEFSWWGWLGAFCWVIVSILSFVAIYQIGMAVPQAVWSGVTIIVSFLWGLILFNEGTKNLPLAIVGLVLMCVGISGVSLCNFRFAVDVPPYLSFLYAIPFLVPAETTNIQYFDSRKPLNNDDLYVVEEGDYEEVKDTKTPTKMNYIIGISVSVFMGIPNGSMLVPTQIEGVPQGVAYLMSFSTGVMVFTLSVVAIYQVFKKVTSGEWEQFKPKECALPGLAAGVGFSSGNFFSIYATQYLGLTIGFPLTQCALLVAGLWGLLVFKEITERGAQVMFFISAVIIICGAGLLSVFG